MNLFKIVLTSLTILSVAVTTAQRSDDIVIGKTITLNSEVLNEERELFIYLPDNYSYSDSKYPVLYLLDGDAHFLHAAGTVTFLSGNPGIMPPVITVGIPNTVRARDFTPTSTENMAQSGGADNFLKFMREELIPYINKNYRTEPYRILFGHSATAMFSVYTLLKEPDLFNGYFAASPYLMYDNNYVLEYARKNLPESFSNNKYLYITLGNEPDYFEVINELTTLLKTKSPGNLEWDYTYMEKDNHSSVPLKTIYGGLERIYTGWRLPDDFAETGNLETIKNHYKNLSSKYDYDVTIAEGVLNLSGYQVMGQGRIKEAIDIFKYNAELYPASANVYDSLGEGLEADNQFKEAKRNYEIACELGKKNNDPNLNLYKQHLENVQKKINAEIN